MWDVKRFIRNLWNEILKSFTLTMWDVKWSQAQVEVAVVLRFTLTMWDVKNVLDLYKWEYFIVLP